MPDPRRPGGWTLLVSGVEQSYVDVDDPRYLKFDYTRRFASLLDTAAPAEKPLRVLHLGGGAMTMARYVAATRPGSAQTVVERDRAVVRLVRRRLPLPEDADVTVRLGDARTLVEEDQGGYDVILADVYDGARVPVSVTSVEFVRAVAGLLAADGVFASNLVDLPPLAFSRVQVATLRTAFADVCAIGETTMLRGKRYGNVVLAGSSSLPVARLARVAGRDIARGRVLHGAELDAFAAGARPQFDAAPPPDAPQ